METIATSSNNRHEKGFTLVEILVAMVIMAIMLFSLASTAGQYSQMNMRNRVRDEAVRSTEDVLNSLRSQQFENITNPSPNPVVVLRPIASTLYTFNVQIQVNDLNPNFKSIRAITTWTCLGQDSTHTATTVVKR